MRVGSTVSDASPGEAWRVVAGLVGRHGRPDPIGLDASGGVVIRRAAGGLDERVRQVSDRITVPGAGVEVVFELPPDGEPILDRDDVDRRDLRVDAVVRVARRRLGRRPRGACAGSRCSRRRRRQAEGGVTPPLRIMRKATR